MFGVALIGAVFWLWTPQHALFDPAEARDAARAYKARIVRDAFGVPHIYGARDADVGFGLAYAHAEDDWATMEEVLLFTRGELGRRTGKDGAITDYLMAAFDIATVIDTKYEKDLAQETRVLVEAYAAGINLYCADHAGACDGVAPVSGRDVVAGFVARTPFFYGLDEHLKALFDGDVKTVEAADRAREAFLKLDRRGELGSNAMAVAPSRTDDGHTRLMVNSHQPFTGPVAWYEARLKSDEGWDMVGALFPGAPLILVGAGRDLGWGLTVNKPDLVDVFHLETNKKQNPTRYKFDGAWRDFEQGEARFRVKLFGPLSLPVKRPVLRSVHGPVFETPDGYYAVSFAGAGEVRAVEQWFKMNKAQNFDEWRAAMAMQAVPSFNAIYGDRAGNIAYFYNASIPVRSEEWDWSKAAPGDRADLIWNGVRPFGSAPSVVNPESGYVVNANHTPFEASGPGDNPQRTDYPPHFGISDRMTNRGLRVQALFGGDASITREEFLQYKMDHVYAPNSRLRKLINRLVVDDAVRADASLHEAAALLSAWGGAAHADDRSAALAIRIGQLALGFLLNGEEAETPDPVAALRQAVDEFETGFGRIDPKWGEVNRLKRGATDLPLNGGPDVLRAIYAVDNPKDGSYTAMAGDGVVVYADWPTAATGGEGAPVIRIIHQFGAATLDKTSQHYDDQAPLYSAEEFRTPPMSLPELKAQATVDKVIGG